MKKIALCVGALSLSLTLVACGSDDDKADDDNNASRDSDSSNDDGDDDDDDDGDAGAYCDVLADAKSQFESLDSGDFSGFDSMADTFADIADSAPSEVSDDWEMLSGAMDQVMEAFDEMGISGEDLQKLSEGEIPENLDLSALEELSTDMESLDTPEFEEATTRIEEHALEECDINLSE